MLLKSSFSLVLLPSKGYRYASQSFLPYKTLASFCKSYLLVKVENWPYTTTPIWRRYCWVWHRSYLSLEFFMINLLSMQNRHCFVWTHEDDAKLVSILSFSTSFVHFPHNPPTNTNIQNKHKLLWESPNKATKTHENNPKWTLSNTSKLKHLLILKEKEWNKDT